MTPESQSPSVLKPELLPDVEGHGTNYLILDFELQGLVRGIKEAEVRGSDQDLEEVLRIIHRATEYLTESLDMDIFV